MNVPALAVHQLTKNYGQYLAVDHISFDVKEGEILGLLGANGAGKSTTIQMLLGLTQVDSGTIEYFGKDFSAHRELCLSRLNFASAYAELQSRMTVYQNLRIYAGLYNVKHPDVRIAELLKLFEIDDHRNTVFWSLSSGQKTRVILAKSFLNRPKMLLMDEPTASLDPDIVFKIIQIIKELQKKESISILFTSHNMDEVSRLCDRVAFLAKGKIATIDTPMGLVKQLGGAKVVIGFEGEKKAIEKYCAEHSLDFTFLRPNLVEIVVEDELLPKALFGLKEAGVWFNTISTEKPSLEDVFLHISREHQLA